MTDLTDEIFPAFSENNVAIACSSSNEYAPYLSVYLQSIYEHSISKEVYDIIIFESDISINTKQKLLEMERPKNVSLRFYNVGCVFSKHKLHISASNFSIQCYYRLALGLIFKNYKKVLFTDVDIISKFNINDLFDIDLKGNPIAASIEISLTDGVISKEHKIYLEENFASNITYYNTGIMIVDVKKFNETATFDELIQACQEKTYRWQEQCVINKVFSGKITPLDSKYNFEIYGLIYNNSHHTYINYMKNIDNAKIYHYLGKDKAWFYPELLKADIWWQYARKTPFYEEILARLIDFKQLQQSNNKLLYISSHFFRFKLKKLEYRLMKHITFGKKKEKYKAKYKALKAQIKAARRFVKELKKSIK